jgi:hypothetical protein
MELMLLLYTIFFAAGASALMYAKFGRRIGYGNAKQVWMVVAIVFIITFFVFYSASNVLLPNR